MARYTGPKCKLCRREGVKLFLKGSRCETEKCALIRKQQAPGQHGTSHRRLSDYGIQLREKQKVKRIYGILEKQFRRYFENAQKYRGKVGEVLLQTLESRLDNVAYRLGMSSSRAHARKLVGSGKIFVNNKVVKASSYQLKAGDTLKFSSKDADLSRQAILPKWLSWGKKKKEGKFLSIPEREDISEEINEQLVVDFYSR